MSMLTRVFEYANNSIERAVAILKGEMMEVVFRKGYSGSSAVPVPNVFDKIREQRDFLFG